MSEHSERLSVSRIVKLASFGLAALTAIMYAFNLKTVWGQYLLFVFFIFYGIFVLATGWTDHRERKEGKRKGIFMSVVEILFGVVMISTSIIALLLILFVLK